MRPAPHEIDQRRSLEWLAKVHAASLTAAETLDAAHAAEAEARIAKTISRCACGPSKIARRNHVIPDIGLTDWSELSVYDVTHGAHGKGTAARSRAFDEAVSAYFDLEYAEDDDAPGNLIHVTCTGYLSPSGAQRMVAHKGWGSRTRVTHAYQMGCYAALPAVRIAAGFLHTPAALAPAYAGAARVDIVHTELCSLHLDPGDHSVEQFVVQSLFADGFIRYAMRPDVESGGLRLLAIDESILPDSAESMSWSMSDAGMHMTLAGDVPAKVAASLRDFVIALYERAGMTIEAVPGSVIAIHPGGPKIIDRVCGALELNDEQVQTSRDVLLDHGNMSSATLPHIWMRLVKDERVVPGTIILGLAFGPGLTVCGGLFRKV